MHSKLESIRQMVLRFRPGDLLLLSEIYDDIDALKTELAESDPRLGAELDEILSLCGRLLKGGSDIETANLIAAVEKLRAPGKAEDGAVVAAADSGQGELSDTSGDDETRDFFRGLLNTFLIDARERLSRAQIIILELEDNESEPSEESLAELFRIFHTIKGESGMLEIAPLATLSHSVESLLSLLREGVIRLDGTLADTLLEGIDHVSSMLEKLGHGESILIEPDLLESFAARVKAMEKGQPDEESETETVPAISAVKATARETGRAARDQEHHASTQIVKVRADRISFLVDMIGELTIALGQVDDQSLRFAHVKKITKSLQRASLELQTDSAKLLFGTLRRSIRDLSKQLGKPVEIDSVGEDLEIDRHLIEKLEEPLVHLVRNCMDHGLEAPEARGQKNPVGRISLSAQRKGGSIVISVGDDGRGLDRDRILATALEKKLVEPEAAAAMSDAEVYALIFRSGFSTSQTITYVSGRGVGMDIVSSFVKANRGKIKMQTEAGKGTRFDLVFPLNTAIMDGMVVSSASRIFVFPVASIVETLRIQTQNVSSVGSSSRVLNLRGEALPLINLDSAVGISDSAGDSRASIGIVTDGSMKRRSVIAVDAILGKQEVVIKPLNSIMRGLRGVSGATILSEGRIGLVLDTEDLVGVSQ